MNLAARKCYSWSHEIILIRSKLNSAFRFPPTGVSDELGGTAGDRSTSIGISNGNISGASFNFYVTPSNWQFCDVCSVLVCFFVF